MQNVLERRDAVNELIKNALLEDLGEKGDITTDSIIEEGKITTFELIVNEDAILSGIDIFKKVFQYLDDGLNIELKAKNGDEIKTGLKIASIKGNARSILKGERVALNFIGHLSGIATLTRKLVNEIKDTKTVLLDTRKTTPGLRILEKHAVHAGDGKNHRMNLNEEVMIKDNHIKCVGSVKEALRLVKEKRKEKIIVEVETEDELKEVIPLSPDVILFDNWACEDLKNALKLVPKSIVTEASGKITLANIRQYALTGVNCISTSYMIKNARWIDFSLT